MLEISILDVISKFIKVFIIIIFTYFTTRKIMNKKENEKTILTIVENIVIAIIYYLLRETIGFLLATIVLICLLALIMAKDADKNIVFVLLYTAISFTINNILFAISSIIIFIPQKILNITNEYVLITLMNATYIILVNLFLNIKKIKNGFDFLNTNINNEYIGTLFLNICSIILFLVILLINYGDNKPVVVFIGLTIFSFIMFITIQKSFKLYYKQKLLVQELDKTKDELAKKTKEVEDLEAENIKISKRNHTLAHKQKSLEYKIEEMIMKAEISKEEAGEAKERLNQIGKELYKEKTATELDKTEINLIDDMLKCMQKECTENKIDFELQLKGNIHHMTNNLISKEDLETLLADHIKNAIIAINHTDNINRSILVRLGKIDEIYGLYIYDSGVEFEPETLENLGKKPSTTHKDEGGTGMGFMNTFDTLRKCNASLIIEEYNEPSKDNFTKAIMIKFDNKNEFKVNSYRQSAIV